MSSRLPSLIALVALTLVGCAKDEVRTYRVPKETPPTLAGASAATAGASALSWTAPSHWQELPASGMRRGSFTLPGEGDATADLSVIAFPGDAGGLAPNLNRWRKQIGLAELSAADAQATVEHVDTPTFHADFVDYSGSVDGAPTRIMGAILHHGGESWFFKLMGPANIVENEAAAFRAFVQSVTPASP
ncbi:hypothetical protein [Synoicihabitans lomoniglobus]|uniref:Lipoprotein n=1 Tax=Synoicihabitans lomoniglobus TaxID=2909285 RepID=A0AAF0CRN3_9BACT|nr:hypothetical protein [Opitutaceae bacterium LMO-M01]WED66726.1 hypothetical protein PXH66_07675 [Opitutaceae bacterium LMO-M01]